MKNNLSKKVIAAAAGGAISAALVLIPAYEGVEYRPYRDVAGVLTVCYGHTGNDQHYRVARHTSLSASRRLISP
ncbi:lysozyme, partial [Morganella morganii]